jgi:hypothetical protein
MCISIVHPASISHGRAKKGTAMLFALLSLIALTAATRAGLALYRVWRAVPRRNADFGIV